MIESYIEVDGPKVVFIGDDALTQDSWIKLVARRKGHIRDGNIFECKEGHEVKGLATLAKVPVYTKFNGEWFFGARGFLKICQDKNFVNEFQREEIEFILLNCHSLELANRVARLLVIDKEYEFSTNFIVEVYKYQRSVFSIGSKNSFPWGRYLHKRGDIPEEFLKELVVDRDHVTYMVYERDFDKNPLPESVVELGMSCDDRVIRVHLARHANVSRASLEKLLTEANNGDIQISSLALGRLKEKLESMEYYA